MKISKYFLFEFQILILSLITYHLINYDANALDNLITIFLLNFLPFIINKFIKNKLHPVSIALYLIINFSSSYLGEYHQFYFIYSWYDNIIHFLSGIMFYLFGSSIFNNKDKIKPYQLALFCFFFSITMLTFWEKLEYMIDFLTNSNHQHWKFNPVEIKNLAVGITKQPNGLKDTMEDLIFGTFGALFMLILSLINNKKIKTKP